MCSNAASYQIELQEIDRNVNQGQGETVPYLERSISLQGITISVLLDLIRVFYWYVMGVPIKLPCFFNDYLKGLNFLLPAWET